VDLVKKYLIDKAVRQGWVFMEADGFGDIFYNLFNVFSFSIVRKERKRGKKYFERLASRAFYFCSVSSAYNSAASPPKTKEERGNLKKRKAIFEICSLQKSFSPPNSSGTAGREGGGHAHEKLITSVTLEFTLC
jgi:hypothetical protein